MPNWLIKLLYRLGWHIKGACALGLHEFPDDSFHYQELVMQRGKGKWGTRKKVGRIDIYNCKHCGAKKEVKVFNSKNAKNDWEAAERREGLA